MEGWYQFGYDGFPSGEVRRRFYRQRDDPCDSGEEQEVYNGNDRPIYYYPMHESEEASSVEEDMEELPLPPTVPFPLRVSAWDSFPGRCGSVPVLLRGDDGDDEGERDTYFFLHGGALAVTGEVINSSEVLRVEGRVSRVVEDQTVSVIPSDASITEAICIRNDGSFAPATILNLVPGSVAIPPRRFGHCAVSIPNSTAYEILSGNHSVPCEMFLTLIIGGAFSDHVPKMLHDVRIRGLVMCEPWLCVTILKGCESSSSSSLSYSASSFNPHNVHSPASLFKPVAQWTMHCPITGLSPFFATPRVFATLTKWPFENNDSKIVSYAYLGGSVNGWDPLPLFGLSLLHVDTEKWTLSSTLLETFGEEPASRFGHSAVIVNSEELYVFGGIGSRRVYLNDLVVLNCRTRVWREVFVPSAFSMPPRAFHSCVQFSHSSNIIIVGGESAGHHESSTWKYNVESGNWCLMTFPLLDRSIALLQEKRDDTTSGRVISATQLLCERERWSVNGREGTTSHPRFQQQQQQHHHHQRGRGCDHHRAKHNNSNNNGGSSSMQVVGSLQLKDSDMLSFSSSGNKGPVVPPLSSYYFAAMHGSLVHVLCMKKGIIVLGGTKSPGVTSVSWIPVRDYSLRESAALWICTHRPHFLLGGGLGKLGVDATRSAFHDSMDRKQCNAGKCCVDVVGRSLAEYQLDQWQRNTHKRLRGL